MRNLRRSRLLVPNAFASVLAVLAVGFGNTSSAAAPVFGYEVVEAWAHDPNAYTEGLAFDHGVLYESTGLNGRSTLRTVALRTGRVLRSVRLAKRHYAEGLTVWAGRAYQLTLLDRLGFVYDVRTLRRQRTFRYDGEGGGSLTSASSSSSATAPTSCASSIRRPPPSAGSSSFATGMPP